MDGRVKGGGRREKEREKGRDRDKGGERESEMHGGERAER